MGAPPKRKARAASNKATMSKAAKKANDGIYDLIHNRYFDAIPLKNLFRIVEDAGLSFDPEEKETFLVGRDGNATWDLFDPDTGNAVDHMLVLTWHKLENIPKYEVVSYVS